MTFDHLYSGSERAIGIGGEHECFVVRDIYTGIIHAYPVADKYASHVIASWLSFAGGKTKFNKRIQMVFLSLKPRRNY